MASRAVLNQDIRESVLDYAAHLRAQGLAVDRVVVFGSHAQGRAGEWSDIDVCIVSGAFGDETDPLEYLWQRLRDVDTHAMIAPVGFHPDNFVDEDPLVWEIKRTGIEL